MSNLNRFLQAQDDFGTYNRALQEMKAGRKTTHWMWFIFPQIKGLGRSYNATYYAIQSLEEAENYLADHIEAVMGSRIDAKKFRSSMTLFDAVCPGGVFAEALEVFFGGQRDPRTLHSVGSAS